MADSINYQVICADFDCDCSISNYDNLEDAKKELARHDDRKDGYFFIIDDDDNFIAGDEHGYEIVIHDDYYRGYQDGVEEGNDRIKELESEIKTLKARLEER